MEQGTAYDDNSVLRTPFLPYHSGGSLNICLLPQRFGSSYLSPMKPAIGACCENATLGNWAVVRGMVSSCCAKSQFGRSNGPIIRSALVGLTFTSILLCSQRKISSSGS